MKIEELYNLYLKAEGVSTDTRKVSKNEIFFALKGPNFNGNSFAIQAIEEYGALLSIVDEKVNHPQCIYVQDALQTLQDLSKHHRKQFDIPVIALTGSNGKTTTKELINAVLSTQFITHATVGNFNNQIGIPLTLLEMKKGTQIAIVEMGANHKGEIASYCEYVCPTHGLITNIGLAHLEGFGGPEGVKIGKSELYKDLISNQGKIFVNGEDSVLMELLSDYQNTIRFGLGESFEFHGKLAESQNGFLTFFWEIPNGERIEQTTQLVGNYNFSNAMYAVSIGLYFKVQPTHIKAAIESFSPENNRSQSKLIGNNTFILDAYNANPSSMKEAILSLSKQKSNNRIAILGGMKEMGEYADVFHEEMVILTLDLNIQTILIGPEFRKAAEKFNLMFFNNSEEAGVWLKENLPSSATILVKGSRGSALEKVLPYMS